jgi:hypothetical protein
MAAPSPILSADELLQVHREYVERAVQRNGGSTKANKPGHRLPFHWPPHPASYSLHVLASDWSGKAEFESDGELFEVEVARTPYGIFGRSPRLWHEAHGETVEEMLKNLKDSAGPLFRRQKLISEALELTGRFEKPINALSPPELVKLLYCRDRDVANDARIQIETRASLGIFGPTLIEVLTDRRHPDRRSAQWCVLDLLEDITSFCATAEMQDAAVQAMRDLLWDAEDDYARTIYKAGVVLGGHLPGEVGGQVLLDCLGAPSRIGRRAAIHGLFHVVEWDNSCREEVVDALRAAAENDPEPVLREYASEMAGDIVEGNYEHVAEPSFDDES